MRHGIYDVVNINCSQKICTLCYVYSPVSVEELQLVHFMFRRDMNFRRGF